MGGECFIIDKEIAGIKLHRLHEVFGCEAGDQNLLYNEVGGAKHEGRVNARCDLLRLRNPGGMKLLSAVLRNALQTA